MKTSGRINLIQEASPDGEINAPKSLRSFYFRRQNGEKNLERLCGGDDIWTEDV